MCKTLVLLMGPQVPHSCFVMVCVGAEYCVYTISIYSSEIMIALHHKLLGWMDRQVAVA